MIFISLNTFHYIHCGTFFFSYSMFTVIQFFVYWECDILNKEMAVHMMTAEDGESALKKWWYSAVVVLRFENKNVHLATQEAKNRQQSRSNVQTHNISCI
eukprot:790860_1